MQINGRKKEVADWAMNQMIGKNYYIIYPNGTEKCKILDIVDNETVTVLDEEGEKVDVSIFNLRAM